MELWKRNLSILCVAQFFVMAAMSLIIPFLPLYLKQDMGIVDENALHLWTGVIFGANFLSAFLFFPFWGKMADRHGRKIMLVRSTRPPCATGVHANRVVYLDLIYPKIEGEYTKGVGNHGFN